MKRKILWLGLTFLLVAALALASCGPAAPGEQEEEEEEEEEPVVPVGEQEEEEEEEEEEEPAVGEPQYGGTLTIFTRWLVGSPPTIDIAKAGYGTQWVEGVLERPVIGDFEKYGPRGTDEYAFQVYEYCPDKYIKGCLLESWELTPEKITWHVRPGVYWQGEKPWVMDARELVAEDIAADLNYFKDSPPGLTFSGIAGDIYATGRYTVVIELKRFDMNTMYIVGYEDRAVVSPPEMITAGITYENLVGTGPWILQEYVVGSYMTYVRNPNYWGKTTINGKEYQVPFADKMILPIIPDVSTQVAALQTGIIDWNQYVPTQYWPTLDRNFPDLLSTRASVGYGMVIVLDCTKLPFSDVNVRRAMMIGLDKEVFAGLWGVGPLTAHWHPMYEGDPTVYTPLEELPPETQLLYDYDPDLARQMIIEAGYPNGFSMEYYTESTAQNVDRAALIKDQLAKIGIEVDIKPVDSATYSLMQWNRTYVDSIDDVTEVGNPLDSLQRKGAPGGYFNMAAWEDQAFTELLTKAQVEPDFTTRTRLLKEASIIMINDVPYLPTDPEPQGAFWWPWIKNYYGERAVSDKDVVHILSTAWIDQVLKKAMGY